MLHLCHARQLPQPRPRAPSAVVLNTHQYPIAVINVWGPAPRKPVKRLHEIGRSATATAEQVRTLLG